MRKLTRDQRAMILHALTEGCGVNATARLCGVSKLTVLRLLADAGVFCRDYHDLMVRALETRRVEVDELWSFVQCKEKSKKRGAVGHGDAWVWVAIDADHKVCIAYRVGKRDSENANAFMQDVASRLVNRVQITSDGLAAYPEAVEKAFGGNVDYSVLVKHYEAERVGEARYSPPKCIGCTKRQVQGNPNEDLVSTSYVERQNLSMRMASRRFTRLTTGFSRRLDNHEAAVALHFFAANFVKKHATLKTTPAVAAGLADRPMTMGDLADLIEQEERLIGRRLSDYQPARTSAVV